MPTRFDRVSIRGIGAEMEIALSVIAEKYGISIEYGGGEFTETNATVHLKLSVKDRYGKVITREHSDFERYATAFGLLPGDFGRSYELNGEEWAISGLKPGNPKYPVLATKHFDGKTYKFPADVVKLALARADEREAGAGDGLPKQLRLTGD